MTYDEFCEAVADAERTEYRARVAVQKIARLCKGRLRLADVDSYTLSALKRELRDWNMHSCEWRTR